MKVKAKLKKIKKENKKSKQVVAATKNLLKTVNEELKNYRSISIPKLKGTGELLNSNILYSNNAEIKENDNY